MPGKNNIYVKMTLEKEILGIVFSSMRNLSASVKHVLEKSFVVNKKK